MVSPIAGDGKVYVLSESGTVAVVRADGSLTILAVDELDDLSYATPAIANGRLYVRTRHTLLLRRSTSHGKDRAGVSSTR